MKSNKLSPRKSTAASARSRKPVSAKPGSSAKVVTGEPVAKGQTSEPPASMPAAEVTAPVPPKKRTRKIRPPAPPTTPARADAIETPAPVASRKKTRKTPPAIPPILLEGDKPASAPVSGPGQRYALGPTPPTGRTEGEGQLPDAYGTQRLLLAARDPHWLYAHWDLTHEQQRRYNLRSADRHLILRVYAGAIVGRPVAEVHVHPESRHWFAYVDRAGTKYVAELGFYAKNGKWESISISGATLTPPDMVSADTSAEFATIPFELPLTKLVSLVKGAMEENRPLAAALEELRAQGHPELPPAATAPSAGPWTAAQERALAEVIGMDRIRRVWMGSLEITELIRRQLAQEKAPSPAGEESGAPTSPAGARGAISSPFGGDRSAKGFWFNVNAELVIYGATEPSAAVTIGGRPIALRSDGSFSYRFALPDGQYELSVVAVSADQTDGRAAEMGFSRSTEYRGEVGGHPQDPELKTPEPANL